MRVFNRLTSRLAPLPGKNIDTDQIIPASYLKVTEKVGLGRGLFAHWRYLQDGAPNPEFVLNQTRYEDALILLAGDNFGSGSSREHAVWALLDYGFQVVVSTRFADIFRANAAKNGLLAATVSAADHATLQAIAQTKPATEVTVDLEKQFIVVPPLAPLAFAIDPFDRHCLLHGVDQLGFLLDRLAEIEDHEHRHPQRVWTTSVGSTERA